MKFFTTKLLFFQKSLIFMCFRIIDCRFYALLGFLYSFVRIVVRYLEAGNDYDYSVKFMQAPYDYFVYLLNTQLISSRKLPFFITPLLSLVEEVFVCFTYYGFFFNYYYTKFMSYSTSARYWQGLSILAISFPKKPYCC